MHFQIRAPAADAEPARDLANLQHQQIIAHRHTGQLIPRRPVRGHAQLAAIGKLDGRSLLVRLHLQRELFALKRDHPFRAHAALVIVHPARNPRAPDLGHAMHRRRRRRDPAQRFTGQLDPLEPVRVFLFDKGRGHVAADEFRMIHDRAQERQIVPDPLHLEPVQRIAHRFDCRAPCRRPGAQLGDHRIVIHADLAALVNAGVVAHRNAVTGRGIALPLAVFVQQTTGQLGRRAIPGQAADRRQEPAIGIFGIKPVLDRPAVQLHIVLRDRQLLAACDPDHLLHQVHPGDQLGHGMFHLQTGVHLQEIEILVAIDDEFHRPGTGIAHRPGQRDRLFAHRLAGGVVQERAGRLFHNLLVAALDRTFPLVQINAVAMRIAQNLNFDMARLGHEFLDENPIIAKAVRRFVLRRLKAFPRLFVIPGDPHSLAAAPGRRLDHHRIADLVRDLHRLVRILDQAHIAGHRRHVGLLRDLLGGDLVAHRLDRPHRRADKRNALGLQRLGEF